MNVLRTTELETNEIKVGDKINIVLKDLGDFTATAQKITEKGIIFLFDDCVIDKAMNENDDSNRGGYDDSDLKRWIDSVLIELFPEDLKSRIVDISIPTYGQIFGHNNYYDNFVSDDDDEQFELMTIRKNRIVGRNLPKSFYPDLNNSRNWYWLKNATKKKLSSSGFAGVSNSGGTAGYAYASSSGGVRPVFLVEVR